ncbi:uncharacterized protein KNAG_0M00970 [Huiozyma naganishii CBS 8797]|uniref:Zn(2)-C6 fungal-type domain-containing protein n=1 Tax=Huiozyma naganishii (strain ATCC MYA-139 / BCRC 22969 / CBS 8797 / KCTC 17520 / NBRC 10181 / NCYC 3082 / Yp74L-3) TaxID=1071383 RepID=J7RDJ7_HUIN7|nr:hypothetical protein KNAG_0M00970 [Kazachstania naganishii CBS 8797]CCK72950.1 hypothetical protein KNAG_0M00970 [Kazachstania naganishii CBS 8797]
MGRPKKEVSEEKIESFQRELELAGDRTDILLKDKRGRSRSCLLCRRRKQRCDHKLPSCTTCLKAGVKCVQPVRYNNYGNAVGESGDRSGSTTPDLQNSARHSPVGVPRSCDERSAGVAGPYKMRTVPPVVTEGEYLHLSPTVTTVSPGQGTDNKVTKTKRDKRANGKDNGQKDDYTKLLEKKLKFLEKLTSLNPNSETFNKKLKQYKRITHLLNGIDDSTLEQYVSLQSPPSTHPGQQPHPYGLLPPPTTVRIPQQAQQQPLQPGGYYYNNSSHNHNSTKRRPSFNDKNIGAPTGTQIGNNPPMHNWNSIISTKQQSPMGSNLIKDTNIPNLNSFDSVDFSTCIFAKYNLKEFLAYDPAFEFDEELSRSFLDTFFTRLQFKYPLLDEAEIYAFHENFVNNAIYSYNETNFHFACGRMWLVYSISACLHMTTGKYRGEPPVRYFSTAIRHITRSGKNLNYVQQIELLTLLVLYLLRTDKDSMVLYEIIKDVMGICKNKLHLNKWHPQDPFAHKKLRLFYCVYLLERMICVAVGKPYTISESEIDLPYLSEDAFGTKDTKIRSGVHFINQSLKLRRIESQFVEQLQILPNGDVPREKSVLQTQLPLVRKFFKDLDIWRSGVVTTSFKSFENETLKLYYYRSVRILIQPYLEILAPEDRLFRECQAAAGQICQLYKIFHQKTITGHSTPAVHTVFVAGVTLIYCMWLARNSDDERRKKLGDSSKHTRPLVNATLFSTMDDLRACSVCLYVMTERSNFARTFRDTFDQLMNATVGNLIERCGPDSAELIYLSHAEKNREKLHKRSSGSTNGTESSFEDQKNSLQESSLNGMPPAMKRTFGRGQVEEHVGFVENSQVDLTEQEELKKKQGVLERTSVPKSLSHLLINEKETHTPGVASGENENLSRGNSCGQDDFKKYVVKKPMNFNEFDWENFEQQAFLQQHFAQQNLQAYLTSLNYGKGAPAEVEGDASRGIEEKMNMMGSPLAIPMSMKMPSSSSSSANPLIPTGAAPGYPQSQAQEIRSGMMMGETSRRGSTQVGAPETAAPLPLPVALPTAHLFPLETNSNNSILLNSGTHDMINNISTWTNDAVSGALVNTHDYTPMGSLLPNGGDTGAAGPQPIQHGAVIAPPPQAEDAGNQVYPAVEPYENGQGRRISANNAAHSATRLSEDFWTINDDYGFLT